jgi:putative transposase
MKRSCGLVELNRSSYYYKTNKKNNEEAVIKRMKELIATHKSWGYPIIHDVLRREGLVMNPKRTWRIYKENNLSLKLRKRHKRASVTRLELEDATRPNERWAMDFMCDGLWNGRKFKVLTVIDLFTKEAIAIEVDTSINGERVTRVLEWLVIARGCPEVITTDNGPEFAGRALDKWAYNNGVKIDFIKPAHTERLYRVF